MESVDKWYKREVQHWRSGAAITWSLLSLPVFCGAYICLSGLQLLSPVQWIVDVVQTVFSFRFVLMTCMVIVVNAGFYGYTCRTFTVIPDVAVSRLAQIRQLLKYDQAVYASVCASTGCVLAWLCTMLLGGRYTALSYRCTVDSEFYCINEYQIFVVLYGGYTGLMYVVYHYLQQHNHLQLPTLQQSKYFQVRGKVLGVVCSSLGHVTWQIKFYYILYYFLGHIPRDWIADILSLKFGLNYRLDSLYGLLLDAPLLWQTALCGMFIQFSWSYGALLYKVYNTEHFEFPVSSMFDNFKNKCLVDAISCNSQPLVQALGFFDLNVLSKHSLTRRKELFSLSQPGGHPHNWNKIVAVCLSVIQELSDQIQDTNWKILSNSTVGQLVGEKQASTQNVTSVGQANGGKDNKLTAPQSFKDKIITGLKKPLVFNYFVTELPEVQSRRLFAGSHIQIWAVEALSVLVAASYVEDAYGVVQMSLSDIVTSSLSLQDNMEKHVKLTGGVGRWSQKDWPANEIPLKYLLQMTLKSSIYRIVNTFGKHILDLGLPLETEKKLCHFMEYRE